MIEKLRKNDFDYSKIEEKLSYSLKPIKPDPQFISRLQGRLNRRNEIFVDSQTKGMIYLLLVGGLVLGSLILFLFRKVT